MKAVVRYAGRGARCRKASLSITLGELVIASIDAVVRRLHRTVIKRPTVPLQEDANVIGPLPPGLYKVAAEAQEAGCSILTEPIPLVGATQRRHTAWLPILSCGSARQRSRRWAGSGNLRARLMDRVAPWRISTYRCSLAV